MINWDDPIDDLIRLKNAAFKDSPTSRELYATWRDEASIEEVIENNLFDF